MKLIIVGSTETNSDDSLPIIEEVIKRLKPKKVGSGCAIGTDTHVELYCKTHDIPFKRFPPEHHSWHGTLNLRGFKYRNLKMAKWGNYGIRIASRRSRSYGSGWTIDQMEKMKKPVERYEVR